MTDPAAVDLLINLVDLVVILTATGVLGYGVYKGVVRPDARQPL